MAITDTKFKLTLTGKVGDTALTTFELSMPGSAKETAKEYFNNFLAENRAVLEEIGAVQYTTEEAMPVELLVVMTRAEATAGAPDEEMKPYLHYETNTTASNSAAVITLMNAWIASIQADLTALGGTAAVPA